MKLSLTRQFTALFITLSTFTGCSSDTTAPKDPGTVAITLRRLTNSTIPPEANNAFIRVWHPVNGINQVKQVPIPAPGQTTTASFSLPGGTGYSVGILAWTGEGSYVDLLASGITENVTITANEETNVSVAVTPWTISITGPDTLRSGKPATLTAKIETGITSIFQGTSFYRSLNSSGSNATQDFSIQQNGEVSTNFSVPVVTTDTAMYVEVEFVAHAADNPQWVTPAYATSRLSLRYPSSILGAPRKRIPVTAPSTFGDLVVSFDKRPSYSMFQ